MKFLFFCASSIFTGVLILILNTQQIQLNQQLMSGSHIIDTIEKRNNNGIECLLKTDGDSQLCVE